MELWVRTEKPVVGREKKETAALGCRGAAAGGGERAGCRLGWPPPRKTLTQRRRLRLILPQDCGRGKKEGGNKSKVSEEAAFCFKGLPLGPVPNFLGFVPDLKGSFMSPMRVCIFVGFKYSLIRCCLFTERKDAFYFILLCHFNLLPFVFNN